MPSRQASYGRSGWLAPEQGMRSKNAMSAQASLASCSYCGLQMLAVALVSILLLGADQDARFQSLGHKLMCRCGCNQILLECNHVGCQYSDKMRQELMAALNGPNSDDLILQGFVQEYGAVVLAAPTGKGFNRTAWVAPFAVLGLGMLAVILVVRRWHARPKLAAAVASASAAHVELDPFRQQARKDTEL